MHLNFWKGTLGEGGNFEDRRGWEDYIRGDIKEIEYEIIRWIPLAQDGDRWWAVVAHVARTKYIRGAYKISRRKT